MTDRDWSAEGFDLLPGEVFTFGSNSRGRHGAGAALVARQKYRAQYGIGSGHTGRCYAIPTKDRQMRVMPLQTIAGYVREFKRYAETHPQYTFIVTRVGTGLANYQDIEMAPLFKGCPSNVILPKAWGGEGFDW